QRGREVQWSAVVRHDDGAVRDGRGELQYVAVVADDGDVAILVGDALGLLLLARARQQHDLEARGTEALGQFAIALVAPMLSRSIQPSGVETEERAVETDTDRAEAL